MRGAWRRGRLTAHLPDASGDVEEETRKNVGAGARQGREGGRRGAPRVGRSSRGEAGRVEGLTEVEWPPSAGKGSRSPVASSAGGKKNIPAASTLTAKASSSSGRNDGFSPFKSALGLLRNTIKVGEEARESLNNTINNTPGIAVRGLVAGVLSDIAGQPVGFKSLRLYPDGVALENIAVGEQLTVEKVVVRARLQPLLAVLSSWKSTPANMTAPPILIESIRLKGIKSVNTDFAGIRKAFNLYVHAPGAIIIGSLKMYDIQANIVPHQSPMTKGLVSPPRARVLRLASMELKSVDSRLPIAKLAGCMVGVDEGEEQGGSGGTQGGLGMGVDMARGEPSVDWDAGDLEDMEGLRGTGEEGAALAAGMGLSTDGVVGGGPGIRPRPPGPTTVSGIRESTSRQGYKTNTGGKGKQFPAGLVPVPPNSRRPAANRDPFEGIRGFIPPVLMETVDKAISPEMVALVNTSQAVFESIAPVITEDFSRILTTDVGAEVVGVAGRGEALLDVTVIATLMAAGLPKRFLANGGALMVKLVESGVAVVLLEQAELLKIMVERRLLERMLDLDLMAPMLDKPELTKQMFRSGVVKGVLSNGVLEALLAAGKEDVVVALLRGPMLEVLMETGLLPVMMTYKADESDPEEMAFSRPPTGSFDDGEEFEIPMNTQ